MMQITDSFDKRRMEEYDENNNLIYYKNELGYESWAEYDEKNREIHYKNSSGKELWCKFDKYGEKIDITEDRKAEKEFLSREEVDRFELMEI